MRARRIALALALTALAASSAPTLADGGSRPATAPQSAAEVAPRPTDAALRAAMTALRDSIEQRARASAGKALGEADYLAWADDIDRQVQAITVRRDFHSRAGRHLQWVLGDISEGTALMRSAPRSNGKHLGLRRVVETLNFYGDEYDHPGWVHLEL